jgi:hypothetical protein
MDKIVVTKKIYNGGNDDDESHAISDEEGGRINNVNRLSNLKPS